MLTYNGVDGKFRAHIAQEVHQESQAIRAGIPMDTILQAAGWHSKSVFEQYHQKEIQKDPKNLTKAVLSYKHTS